MRNVEFPLRANSCKIFIFNFLILIAFILRSHTSFAAGITSPNHFFYAEILDEKSKIALFDQKTKLNLEQKLGIFLPCMPPLELKKTISSYVIRSKKLSSSNFIDFKWLQGDLDPKVQSCLDQRLKGLKLEKLTALKLNEMIIRFHAIPMSLKSQFAKGAEFNFYSNRMEVSVRKKQHSDHGIYGGNAGAGKPVIYLYPKQRQIINLSLDVNGSIDLVYPQFNLNSNSWKVIGNPNGRIELQGYDRTFNYLFWEGKLNTKFDLPTKDSFLIRGQDSILFLEKSLREMGLSDYEANEFIVYWAPKMLVHNYNVVRFFDDQYTKEARLQVEPKPDSLLRVFMVFKGLTSAPDSNFDGQKFAKFQRKGFALVEWGGDEVK